MVTAHAMKGYTLVELVIVMAIMVVVGAGAVVGYVNFNERQQVVAAAKNVQQAFRTAQARARTKSVPKSISCTNFQGYSVTTETNQVKVKVVCDGAPIAAETVPITGATLTSTKSPLTFKTLEQGTDGAAIVTITGVVIYVFTVSPQGTVSDIELVP